MNAPRQVATVRRQCPNTGNWITAPAAWFAPPRIKQSDITRYGSFQAARDAVSRRLAAPADGTTTPAIEASAGSESAR